MTNNMSDAEKGQGIIDGFNREKFTEFLFPKNVNDATDAMEMLHGLEDGEDVNIEFIRSLGVDEADIQQIMAHTQATGKQRKEMVPFWKAALRRSETSIASAFGIKTEELVNCMRARNDVFFTPEMHELVKALSKEIKE